MTLDLNTIGGIIGVASAVGGALWWLYRHAQKVGEWKAQREGNEARAKDETRLTINRIEPKLDALMEVNQKQSEQLAVITHRTGDIERRITDLAETVDEHGARITRLETKETKS